MEMYKCSLNRASHKRLCRFSLFQDSIEPEANYLFPLASKTNQTGFVLNKATRISPAVKILTWGRPTSHGTESTTQSNIFLESQIHWPTDSDW